MKSFFESFKFAGWIFLAGVTVFFPFTLCSFASLVNSDLVAEKLNDFFDELSNKFKKIDDEFKG